MFTPVWFSFFRPKTKTAGRLFITLSSGLFALSAQAESGTYVPYSGIIHGTDGADPVEISIMNETGILLDCRAALAHWYSDELGQIAAGERITLTMWHDSETGVLNLMNATDDRMPVEAVWCATDTARTRLALPMTTGKAETRMQFSCRVRDDATLNCDVVGG